MTAAATIARDTDDTDVPLRIDWLRACGLPAGDECPDRDCPDADRCTQPPSLGEDR